MGFQIVYSTKHRWSWSATYNVLFNVAWKLVASYSSLMSTDKNVVSGRCGLMADDISCRTDRDGCSTTGSLLYYSYSVHGGWINMEGNKRLVLHAIYSIVHTI